MSLKKIMLLFAAGSLVLAGCSDDNPTDPIPEDADDNFITSVVLTVGDNSYAAEIAGNDITVTVPYNVSLDGATAEFEYTPSATIMPDPSTITDWDTERQFRVTSYNGETNDYKYLVVKDDIREEGDVKGWLRATEVTRFLSTPSARRATARSALSAQVVRDFYPRPPRGGRRILPCFFPPKIIFLSTPSARRATPRKHRQRQTV